MSAQAERPGSHIAVVIPAYNEERTIAEVIRGLKAKGYNRIIVVDDGSTDRTAELARREQAVVVSHVVNRGLGGALGTGIKAALALAPEIIITFDADGQHDPDEILLLSEPIARGETDVVIGSRMVDPGKMPWTRRLANRMANLVTFSLFGVWVTDSQSGLRAFSRMAAERLRVMTSGMEASSELIAEIGRNKLRLKEVPIKAIYTEYSLSKGQSFKVGLYTLVKLVLAKLRRPSS